ncbi:hypothetical protein MRB53_009402 [Persea americana]|uniref:Uncharacterized protein n=1 Tax=Persea americana TaxID=3435 RepID=A0ACC2LPA1_PERAE|nr:hypothetical protein MRB53_009402 [Persea americana]
MEMGTKQKKERNEMKLAADGLTKFIRWDPQQIWHNSKIRLIRKHQSQIILKGYVVAPEHFEQLCPF